MNMVYLGLFDRVFEWVLSHIMEPVYKFVANLLTTVLSWVFQKLLAPILMPILKETLYFAIDLWKTLYSVQLYSLFSGVLKLIDYLETAFDVFIGVRDVTYTDRGTRITGSLLEVLIQQKTVSTVFWALTLGALGLALVLTVYATAKSAFDLDFENKRPVSKVLASMMKTFIQFFTVPFLVYFLLKLAGVILKTVTDILSFGTGTTLGRIVFVIASLDAAKDASYNISTAGRGITLGTSSADKVRYPYYALGGGGGTKDYGNIGGVMENFNLGEFDYLIGFLAAIFLLFTIGVCLIIFVQRIFELILLYIVSPYFVCTMPLDDGEKFSRWREMFVGKCFTGFGSAIGMRLYLMLCPMVMGNAIRFGVSSSPEMDYMMKLFFLAGGAWAVYKSGPMITSLLSFQAGQGEMTTAAVAGGLIFSQTAGRAIGAGQRLMSRGVGALVGGRHRGIGAGGPGGMGTDGISAGGKGAGNAQQFQGSRGGASIWKPNVSAVRAGQAAGAFGKAAGRGGAGISGSFIGTPGIGAGHSRSGISIGGHRAGAGRGGAGISGSFIGTPRIGEGYSRSGISIGGHRAGAESGGAGISIGSQRAGESMGNETFRHHNFQLGSVFRNTYDEQGNRTFRMLGMGFTSDAAGRTTSVSLPCLSLQRNNESGRMHVSQGRLPGIASFHTNVEGGKLKFSDLNVLGMRCSSDEQGSRVSLGGAFSIGRGADGSVSHVRAGAVRFNNDASGVGMQVGNRFGIHSDSDGTKVNYGNHVSIQTSGDRSVSSFQIGAIQYSRTGAITRTVGQGSAAAGQSRNLAGAAGQSRNLAGAAGQSRNPAGAAGQSKSGGNKA